MYGRKEKEWNENEQEKRKESVCIVRRGKERKCMYRKERKGKKINRRKGMGLYRRTGKKMNRRKGMELYRRTGKKIFGMNI